MTSKILNGIKIGLGIVVVFTILFGLVYAAGFHYPSEIVPGIFQTGNYSFNGSLGIGTNAPLKPLHVEGGIYSFDKGNVSSGTHITGYFALQNGGSDSAGIHLGYHANGSNADYGIIYSDGYKKPLHFQRFEGGLVSSMVIDGSGNVGIGTSTPISTLSILSGNGESNEFIVHNSAIAPNSISIGEFSTSKQGYIGFNLRHSSTQNTLKRTSDGVAVSYFHQDGLGLNLFTGGGNTAGTDFSPITPTVYFKYNGNVGIGTTDPQAKLDVNGDIRAYGISVSNTINIMHHYTKTTANSICPLGSVAIYTPWSYNGKTGSEICAADARGKYSCTAVKYVYGRLIGDFNTYSDADKSCSNNVDISWPWASFSTVPDTLDGEWHLNTYVVCCQ